MLAVGDIVRQPGTSEMLGFRDRLALPHAGGFSDLQAARLGDSVVAAAASSAGRVGVLAMGLPGHAGATAADLALPGADGGGGDAALLAMPWQHKGPVSSVSVNSVTRVSVSRRRRRRAAAAPAGLQCLRRLARTTLALRPWSTWLPPRHAPPSLQSLLSVGQDGAIYVAPIDAASTSGQQQQQQQPFRQSAGYAGYSQGRWMDSNTFVTVRRLGSAQATGPSWPGA
jgi:hypothetical protein